MVNRYRKLLNYLFSLSRFKKRKTDLTTFLTLAQALGSPHEDFPSIHIAGTNGKGSVAYKIANSLSLSGYRVGLFTSPHLFTYRERIQINGKFISEEEVVEGLEKILASTEGLTFFEVTTLLAFDYFSKKKVEIAVVETGMGGRFDATNILQPILSIITTIDYDHTHILGTTLEAIAIEKAGIIKKNIPVVVGKKACFMSIFKKSDRYYIAGKSNISIAKEALKHIPFKSNDLGLQKEAPCRYEKHGDLIYDVAHNAAAFLYLFKKIKHDFPHKKIHVLLGISKNKQIDESVKVIRNFAHQIRFIQSTHSRLISSSILQSYVPEALIMSIEEAYDRARLEHALMIVTGSFYIMAEVRSVQNLRANGSMALSFNEV